MGAGRKYKEIFPYKTVCGKLAIGNNELAIPFLSALETSLSNLY